MSLFSVVCLLVIAHSILLVVIAAIKNRSPKLYEYRLCRLTFSGRSLEDTVLARANETTSLRAIVNEDLERLPVTKGVDSVTYDLTQFLSSGAVVHKNLATVEFQKGEKVLLSSAL